MTTTSKPVVAFSDPLPNCFTCTYIEDSSNNPVMKSPQRLAIGLASCHIQALLSLCYLRYEYLNEFHPPISCEVWITLLVIHVLSMVPARLVHTKLPIKRGHLTNQDIFICPKGVHNKEIPLCIQNFTSPLQPE